MAEGLMFEGLGNNNSKILSPVPIPEAMEGKVLEKLVHLLRKLLEDVDGIADLVEKVITDKIKNGEIKFPIDYALSEESENAVQNKVVTKYLNKLKESIVKVDAFLSANSANAVQNSVVTKEIENLKEAIRNIGTVAGEITIDSELSETSSNPVKNSVITKKVFDILALIDTLYDCFDEYYEFGIKKYRAKLASRALALTVSDQIDFADSQNGVRGAGIWKDEDGWHFQTDFLHVFNKATFTTVEIKEVRHVGGIILLSAADCKVSRVEKVGEDWKLYFNAKGDDGTVVTNMWRANDIAYCQTMNVSVQAGGSTFGNRFYKYIVKTKGTIGNEHYIILDGGNKAASSDEPKAGDSVVQLGSLSDRYRQNAIIINGSDIIPYIRIFTGINSFVLPDPETQLMPGNNIFSGTARFLSKKVTIDGMPINDYIKGNDGISIVSVTEYYLASPLSEGVFIHSKGWTTEVQLIDEEKKYLWNYEAIKYSNGKVMNTAPAIIGTYGDKGVGISYIMEFYLASTEVVGITRESEGWTQEIQTIDNEKRYLWNYEVVVYTDGTEEATEPVIIGVYGDKGDSNVIADLDNEMDSVIAGADGNFEGEVTLSTNVSMWYGFKKLDVTDVTAPKYDGVTFTHKGNGSCEFKVTSDIGLKTNIVLTVNAEYEGMEYSRELTFTINKINSGANGSNAVVYSICTSASSINKNNEGKLTPSSVSAYVVKSEGSKVSRLDASDLKALGLSIEYATEEDGFWTTEDKFNNIPSVCSQIIFRLMLNNTTEIDRESIPIISDGISVSGVTEYYLATSADSGVTTETEGWTTEVQKVDAENRYLWNYEVISYTSGKSPMVTTPVIIGMFGENGIGIDSIEEWYLKSASSVGITTSDEGWSREIPTIDAINKYLWNYEVIVYTDGTRNTTYPVVIGAYGDKGEQGEKGEDGNGIDRVIEWYMASAASEGITNESPGWSTSIPALSPEKKYLWNYEEIIYTKSEDVRTNAAIIGVYGEDGNGISKITEYYMRTTSASAPDISDSGWSTIVPTIDSTYRYLWNYELIEYTNGTSQTTQPAVIGVYGQKGDKGENGNNGIGIKEIKEKYSASPNSTGIGYNDVEWYDTVQYFNANNRYLWNYEIVVYTNGTEIKTTPKVIGVYGQQGKGISSVVEYYLATSAASGVTTSTYGWTTSVQTITSTKKYLWNYEAIQWSDGTTTTTTPVIIGVYGEKGEQGPEGRYEVSRTIWLTRTETAAPQNVPTTPTGTIDGNVWTSDSRVVPTQAKPYLWGFDQIYLSDGSEIRTSVRLLAKAGADANLLDWVKQWDGKSATINGQYVMATGIYAGSVANNTGVATSTGIAMGKDIVSTDGGSSYRSGLYAFKNGVCVCAIDPENSLLHLVGRFANGSITKDGNVTGKCCVMDDTNIRFFDTNAALVNTLSAEKVTTSSVFGSNPVTFTKNSSYQKYSFTYSSSPENTRAEKYFCLAYLNTARTESIKMIVNGVFYTSINLSKTSKIAYITTKLIFRKYSSSISVQNANLSTPYLVEYQLFNYDLSTANGSNYNNSVPQVEINNDGTTAYKYALFLVCTPDASKGTDYTGATLTLKWGTVNYTQNISIETPVLKYISSYGANGLLLGTSSQDYFAVYDNAGMMMDMICKNKGFKIVSGKGFIPYYGGQAAPMPVCLFAGRVTVSSSSANITYGSSLGGTKPDCSVSTTNGVSVDWSNCGWEKYLGMPSLNYGNIHIQATPYGNNSAGSYYDTAIAVRTYSNTSCLIFTSNDRDFSASSFFLKIEYIL